jgi:hypothetical protein
LYHIDYRDKQYGVAGDTCLDDLAKFNNGAYVTALDTRAQTMSK